MSSPTRRHVDGRMVKSSCPSRDPGRRVAARRCVAPFSMPERRSPRWSGSSPSGPRRHVAHGFTTIRPVPWHLQGRSIAIGNIPCCIRTRPRPGAAGLHRRAPGEPAQSVHASTRSYLISLVQPNAASSKEIFTSCGACRARLDASAQEIAEDPVDVEIRHVERHAAERPGPCAAAPPIAPKPKRSRTRPASEDRSGSGTPRSALKRWCAPSSPGFLSGVVLPGEAAEGAFDLVLGGRAVDAEDRRSPRPDLASPRRKVSSSAV